MVTDASRRRFGKPGPQRVRLFRAERAISPLDGSEFWVVIDAELVAHREATDFLRCLHGASRSPHTIRAYAGRVAAFLGWCETEGINWRTIELADLARFKHWVEVSPMRDGRPRLGSTVNAVLTAVGELSAWERFHDYETLPTD